MMRIVRAMILAAMIWFADPLWSGPGTAKQDDLKLLGVFGGTTLCGEVSKPLLKISPEANCDRVVWELALYHDGDKRRVYKLTREFGYHVDNRTLKSSGTIVIEGQWIIRRGAKADPESVVYELHSDKPGRSLSFLKLDENLLHLLDIDSTLMVGNGAQSYTLYRIGNH